MIDSTNTTRVTKAAWTFKLLTIMLANVMSLVPKMHEVSEFILRRNINLTFITQTFRVRWLCTNSRVRGGAKGQASN